MENRKSNIRKFMARFTAKKLCPSLELSPEEEQMVNKHLWYIRAYIIKDKITKAYGEDIMGCIYALGETTNLSPKRFIEFLQALEYAFPQLIKNVDYHIEVGHYFEDRCMYKHAMLSYSNAIILEPKEPVNYYLRGEVRRLMGDANWEDDHKIADELNKELFERL